MEKRPGLKELEEKQKQKALTISIKEGTASSISSNLGDSFITPFALEVSPVKMQSIIIGILSAFSSLLAQLSQLKGSRLIHTHPRKQIVMVGVLTQALLWIPIAALAFLVWQGLVTGIAPYILITLYCALTIVGGLHYPSWFSWMGDLVPEKERGRYFSKRNLIVGIVGLAVALIGGFILKALRTQNLLLIGFSVIFLFAFFFRMVSYFYLKRQYAPPGGYKNEECISFKEFRKQYPNFMKFSMYQMFFNFAIMVASPFFAVYMLEDLGLKSNYALYMIISVSSTAFYLLFLPLVGKFSDKYGNLKLLYIANISFAIGPVLWTLSRNPVYLLFVPQITSGIANAALTIALTSFTYGSVSNHHRGSGVAYSNILIGIGTFVGAISGGIILNYLTISFMDKFLFVFLLAAGLRLLVAIIFLPGIKEIAKTHRIPYIHAYMNHPFRFINTEITSFTHYSERNLSQGLKVWNPPNKNVLQKERKRR